LSVLDLGALDIGQHSVASFPENGDSSADLSCRHLA
jgi:hypothetical protein